MSSPARVLRLSENSPVQAWTLARQKGSHVMMTKTGFQWTLSIPQHQELGPGLLRKLIRQSGLTVEHFTDL